MKGTIRLRATKDGVKRYTCQVFAGYDPRSGRKRFLTATAKSEREAHRVLHRLAAQVESGQVSRERATLNQLIEAWLETGGPSGENTRIVYEGYARNHVAKSIGKMAVSKIRVEDLDRWHAALRTKGLSPSSIRKAHNIVRGALTQGVKWGWIPSNVATQSKPPVVPKPVIATPDAATVRALLRSAADHDPEFGMYIRLAAVTGARPGEMCGLRWTDIDWSNGDLAIERRVIRTAPTHQVKSLTKTGKVRRIPLDHGTLKALKEHRRWLEERAEAFGTQLVWDAYVFSESPDGATFWRPDSTSRRFRAACDHAGLTGIALYGLRHQAATTMIDRGVDPKTVSERLGNSVATVLSTYTRARSSADRSAADLMGSLLDE